jgi:3-methyladenine DNA glycosylase AlkD
MRRVNATRRPPASVVRAAAEVRRDLARLARPAGGFDARRYFRGDVDLAFHNVGTARMRALARAVHDAHRDRWSLDDAVAFADLLIRDRYLEVKSVGIEVLARYRRSFAPRLLPTLKRWLAQDHAGNWATTDAICGYLVGPLLVMYPELAPRVGAWAAHPNLWVRRASVVALIPSLRRGAAQDVVYAAARRLHPDSADLIHKAVGWALREAGRADPSRLERYLRQNGRAIPRTTIRYAIERMSPDKRRDILTLTRRRSRGHSGEH